MHGKLPEAQEAGLNWAWVEINLNRGGILYLGCVCSNAVYPGRKPKGIDGGIGGEEVNREKIIEKKNNQKHTFPFIPSFLWVPKAFDTFGEVGVSFYHLPYSLQYPNSGQIKGNL